MKVRRYMWMLVWLTIASTMSWAQTDYTQTSESEAPVVPLAVASDEQSDPLSQAQGQGQTSERRSFFLAGAHIGDYAETDSSQLSSTTNIFGNLSLLSLRRRSETAIDYLGGVEVTTSADSPRSTNIQVHQFTVSHRLLWRRRELTLFDNFGDLPGGEFGSTWSGGAALYSLIDGNANQPPANVSNFFGSGELGGFGGSHISNVSLAEYRELLTRRSSVTMIGGYGVTDYAGGQGFINSHVFGVQVSYGQRLDRRNQVGFSYRFQRLAFPEIRAGNIVTNSVELTYGRRVSTRTSLTLAGGPESVSFGSPANGSTTQIDYSGNASLTYLLRKATVALGCGRMVASGSGLFAGGNTDTCQFSVQRHARKWSVSLNSGYASLTPIRQAPVGIQAYGYQYAFVGGAINRELGPHCSAFAGYQFNDQSLGSSTCAPSTPCNQLGQHLLSAGINFRTKPRRLE